MLLVGVALGDDDIADGDELLLVEDVEGEELLHAAAARRTVTTATRPRRLLPSNHTTTALPFSRRWTGQLTSADATHISVDTPQACGR